MAKAERHRSKMKKKKLLIRAGMFDVVPHHLFLLLSSSFIAGKRGAASIRSVRVGGGGVEKVCFKAGKPRAGIMFCFDSAIRSQALSRRHNDSPAFVGKHRQGSLSVSGLE